MACSSASDRRRPSTRCVFPSQPFVLDVSETRLPAADSRWRAVVRVLRSQADSLASAVFPTDCALCHTPLARLSRAPVCLSCWDDLPPQTGSLCLQCGEALGAHAFASPGRAPGDWLCRPCRMAPPAFDRAVAWGLYRGTMRSLIHLLKYDGIEPVAGRLGALMAAQVAALPGVPRQMTVVPVPLFRGKLKQRGFNQAALLARSLARSAHRHGMTLRLDTQVLVRRRSTESQAGLTPAGRRRNLQAAFAVPAAAGGATPLAGRDVLLVDDIYTTGATARSAADALRRAGAREVWVATLARAQRQDLAEPVQAVEIPMAEDVASWG